MPENHPHDYAKTLNTEAGNYAHELAVLDLDRDGVLDVLTADWVYDTFVFQHGNGDGTFESKMEFGADGQSPRDFDYGAGPAPDLYVLCNEHRTVSWIHNVTPGGTTAVPPLPDHQHPGLLELASPYPNPVNGASVIGYSLVRSGGAEINVFDVRGTLVRRLLPRQEVDSGAHRVVWDLKDESGVPVAAGVYLVQGRAGDDSVVRKILVGR